ncbi:MAG: site-2 protease family protein [Candidatus Sumerlaeota bacterium]|nr:site-2 protease family protein [Candidatus Sumerlaeota bacterium]
MDFNIGEWFAWYVVFLFITTLHEAAHAWVAKLGGDLTAYHGGQVSIDPFPHIRREPFGMVLFPLISLYSMGWPLGFASCPYDARWARVYPRRAAVMALAGPLSSLAILIVVILLIWAGVWHGVLDRPHEIKKWADLVAATEKEGVWIGVAAVLSMSFIISLIGFVFNLLPLPPLDGSGVLMLFMRTESAARYQIFMSQPMISIIGLLIAWRIFGYLFSFIYPIAYHCLYPSWLFG